MKNAVLVLFLLSLFLAGFSQEMVKGIVKDSKTKNNLAFCSITIKKSRISTITNNEGEFKLKVFSTKDTLLVAFLGYITKTVTVEKLQRDQTIYLVPVNLELEEFTVHADNDYLYDMLLNCRKRLQRNNAKTESRAYFGLQTHSENKPLEILECYFNSEIEGENVNDLKFKNGRTALAPTFKTYFISENTSKAFTMIKLTSDEGFFPALPLQFNKHEMKKKFMVKWEEAFNDMTHLKFWPLKDTCMYFSGDIWLDKSSSDLMKIRLTLNHVSIHPFLPLFPEDSITNVSLSICNSYKRDGSEMVPDYFNFDYSFTYHCIRDTPMVEVPYKKTRDISTNGVMLFYDYGDPFFLPRFEYNNSFHDYRKMSIIPYNTFFWENNNKLLLTGQQNDDLNFLSEKGLMINFGEGNYGTNFLKLPGIWDTIDHALFEYNYTFWSANKRVFLSKQYFHNEVYSKEKINQSFARDLYNLKVQLLLDVNKSGDSINFRTYTVFDSDKTFFHLPELQWTNAFINIYFDICEIERRKLDLLLMKQHSDVQVINSLYDDCLEKMDKITTTYLDEVEQGKNEKQLKKWNNYVKDSLGIDNMKMFGEADAGKK